VAIVRDESGNPKPQYETATPNVFEAAKGSGGAIDTNIKAPLPAGEAILGKVGIDQTVGQNIVSFGATAQPVSITGSLAKLSTEEFPVGVDGNTCIEFYPDNTTKYYYYYGAWREI